jgi:hypothetical protein
VLPVPARGAGDARLRHGVDLVQEQDAGRGPARLGEQPADAERAEAHEHLDEVGAGGVQEGHAGLLGQGGGEPGLAVARRAVQQHAPAGRGADRGEAGGVAQVGDDVAELGLRLLLPGDPGEAAAGSNRRPARAMPRSFRAQAPTRARRVVVARREAMAGSRSGGSGR